MDDLISRQEVLKHIEKIRQGQQMMDDTHVASVIMNGMYLCEKVVRNQPSAQPEIIRCKDCDWWTKQKDSLQGRCELMKMYPTGGWFCANARRKERR